MLFTIRIVATLTMSAVVCCSAAAMEAAPWSAAYDEWLRIDVRHPREVVQAGAYLGWIDLENVSDDARTFYGVLPINIGAVVVDVLGPGGDVLSFPGDEALSAEANPLFERVIEARGVISIPVYILKQNRRFVFEEPGEYSVTVRVPRFDVESAGVVTVNPREISDEYREYLERFISVFSPFSWAVGDEHALGVLAFEGVERQELGRFVEWMYGHTLTRSLIMGQAGDPTEETLGRIRKFAEVFRLSFDEIDALSSSESYWSLYDGHRTPARAGNRIYLY